MPSERKWVNSIIPRLHDDVSNELPSKFKIEVTAGSRLPYAYEVFAYDGDSPLESKTTQYETDILFSECSSGSVWIPRIIIECKLNSITTHDAITYSTKASTHKNVHPYLRYGVLLGNRGDKPLPGRLIRHGVHFDFMISWKGYDPEAYEWNSLVQLLGREIRASKILQEALASSRSKSRKRYYLLHRRLDLK